MENALLETREVNRLLTTPEGRKELLAKTPTGTENLTQAAKKVVEQEQEQEQEQDNAYIMQRVNELQSAIPEGARGRVTRGVGIVKNTAGQKVTVISTREPRGYLRSGVAQKLHSEDVVISARVMQILI
jgi:Ca2+-dependent lipid-binding protein